MYSDEVNAKMPADQAYYGNLQQQETCAAPDIDRGAVQGMAGQAATASRLGYSLRAEAAKRAQHHHSEGEKAQSAAQFFAMNPQFEDFIRLIRSGAIKF